MYYTIFIDNEPVAVRNDLTIDQIQDQYPDCNLSYSEEGNSNPLTLIENPVFEDGWKSIDDVEKEKKDALEKISKKWGFIKEK